MKSRAYIIIGVMLLFASCGQQYQAERTVGAFVDDNAENPDLIAKRDFADLGTTRHITDSLVSVMRQRGAEHFKKGISYPAIPQGDLYYLRMRYVYEGDTLQNTFYLNEELTEVVAFK
ncbi:MAG: hypothetical protein IJ067_08550 [Prevotella sp.]|nr:hypothetical protein [Prevotella sp.]